MQRRQSSGFAFESGFLNQPIFITSMAIPRHPLPYLYDGLTRTRMGLHCTAPFFIVTRAGISGSVSLTPGLQGVVSLLTVLIWRYMWGRTGRKGDSSRGWRGRRILSTSWNGSRIHYIYYQLILQHARITLEKGGFKVERERFCISPSCIFRPSQCHPPTASSLAFESHIADTASHQPPPHTARRRSCRNQHTHTRRAARRPASRRCRRPRSVMAHRSLRTRWMVRWRVAGR